MTNGTEKKKKKRKRDTESQVSIYPAWCKRCGNCVEFCPSHAMGRDQWGFPRLDDPEKCTSCHLCEKLCPDFAISIPEKVPRELYAQEPVGLPSTAPHDLDAPRSPERVAPRATVDADEDPEEK